MYLIPATLAVFEAVFEAVVRAVVEAVVGGVRFTVFHSKGSIPEMTYGILDKFNSMSFLKRLFTGYYI